MGIFRKFCRSMIDKGGLASIGIFCTVLFLNGKLPSYMGPVAYGVTTFGIFGVIGRIAMYRERKKSEDILVELDKLQRVLLDERCPKSKLTEMLHIIAITKDLVKIWRNDSWILDARLSELKVIQGKLCLQILKASANDDSSEVSGSWGLEEDKNLLENLLDFKDFENKSLGLDKNIVNQMIKEHAENEDDRFTSLQEKASKLFENLGFIPGDDYQNRQGHNLKARDESEETVSSEDTIESSDKSSDESGDDNQNGLRHSLKVPDEFSSADTMNFYSVSGEKSDGRSKIEGTVEHTQIKRKVSKDEKTEKDVDHEEYLHCEEYLSPPSGFQPDDLAKTIAQKQSGEQIEPRSAEDVYSRLLQEDNLMKKDENTTVVNCEETEKLSDKSGEKSEEIENQTLQHTQNKHSADEKTDSNSGIQSTENIKEEAPAKKEVSLDFLENFPEYQDDWLENLLNEVGQDINFEGREIISYIREIENAATGYDEDIGKLSDKAGEKSEENESQMRRLLHAQIQHEVAACEKIDAKVEIRSMEKIDDKIPVQDEIVKTQLPSLVSRNEKILLRRKMLENMIRKNAKK